MTNSIKRSNIYKVSAVFKRAYDRYCKQYELNQDSQSSRIFAAYQAILVSIIIIISLSLSSLSSFTYHHIRKEIGKKHMLNSLLYPSGDSHHLNNPFSPC